jgi:hypothetical protein
LGLLTALLARLLLSATAMLAAALSWLLVLLARLLSPGRQARPISLFGDFCNKIGTNAKSRNVCSMSASLL